MSFEEGLFQYLDDHAGLSMQVDSRIYPVTLPQNAIFPAVTYTRLATPLLHELNMTSFLPHPTFQFDCWAESYARAKAVATQVFAALDMYWGAMGVYTVQASIVSTERDTFDPETKIWHTIVDCEIWYEV